MRRLPGCCLLASLILFLSIQDAGAQAGFFSSARVLERGSMAVGAELIAGSIGFMGHARYGAGDRFDIAVKTGILHESSLNRFQIGFDGRYPFMAESSGDQADVNVTALFNLSTGQSVTSWSLGAGPQFGKTFPFTNSDVTMAPYAGILLGATHIGTGGGIQEIEGVQYEIPKASATDFAVLLPLGADIRMNETIGFFGEVDIDFDGGTDAAGAFGVNYNYR